MHTCEDMNQTEGADPGPWAERSSPSTRVPRVDSLASRPMVLARAPQRAHHTLLTTCISAMLSSAPWPSLLVGTLVLAHKLLCLDVPCTQKASSRGLHDHSQQPQYCSEAQ